MSPWWRCPRWGRGDGDGSWGRPAPVRVLAPALGSYRGTGRCVQVRGCSGGCCSGVGKLRHGRWAAATLLAAVAAASCEHLPAAPPGAAGYLAAGRSSVAFLRLPGTPGAAVSGSLELNAISGTAPHTTVSARTYPFTGRKNVV